MYTYVIFGLREMSAIAVLTTKEQASDWISKFYKDQLPQYLHGVDLNNMEWALKTENIQVINTKTAEQVQQQQTAPPGTAPVWKPNFNSGRN